MRQAQRSRIVVIVVGLAGCGVAQDRDRIEVADPNDLGVTALETSHTVDHANQVFALRAFSADERELAHVQLTTGAIADVTDLGAGDVASEIIFAVGDVETRLVSRETERFVVDATNGGPEIARFLEIGAVGRALAREANIEVERLAPDSSEQPYTSVTGFALQCPVTVLRSSQVAQECCYDSETFVNADGEKSYSSKTLFHLADQTVSRRIRNTALPQGQNGCKGPDGVSFCGGDTCYFGPLGFSRPILTSPPAGTYAYVYSTGGPTYKTCTSSFNAVDPAPIFGNVTGTFPAGQGCPSPPAGHTYGAGQWD